MNKIFFFAVVMMAAISMSAENVFDWTKKVGKITYTGAVSETTVNAQKNKESTPCIQFENGYETNGVYCYAELTLEGSKFLAGDVVNIEYCYNNSSEKMASVAVYTTGDVVLAESAGGKNARFEEGFSLFQYVLKEDMDTIRIARATSGKTKTCVVKLEVVRGDIVIDKAGTPAFSVAGATYFDPFKLGISSSIADKIYYSINNAEFVEYKDSIDIAEYDKEYNIAAFATLEGAENSDTATVTYKLKHFVARPVFNARVVYEFAGVKADDINILSGTNATKGTYKMDGVDVPSVSYKHLVNESAGRDSFMIVNIKDKGDVTFRYKNQNDKKDIMKFAADYIQCDGSNFEMWIENVQAGDTIVFVVTAKGSAPQFTVDASYSSSCYLDPYQPEDDTDLCYTDGIVLSASDAKVEDNYSGWQNLVYTVQQGRSRVRIKEVKNGFRLAKILVGAYRGVEAVDNVDATVKAIKTIENGQLVIIKNGVRYNALGAQL